MEPKKVNKKNPIPMYYQLKNILRGKIESGELKIGDRIPSIPELSKTHQMSQMTARHAITELRDEGLLYSIKGNGTFVAKPKIDRDLSHLTYFTEQIARSGVNVTTKLLKSEIMQAPKGIADKLEIQEGTPTILLHRIREIDNEPFYLESCYFPHVSCKGLLEKDLSQHSLYYLLENDLGYHIDHALMTIEAVGANSYQSQMIRIKKGAPLLSITHTTYLTDGTAIQFVKAVSRSDKFQYSLKRRRINKTYL